MRPFLWGGMIFSINLMIVEIMIIQRNRHNDYNQQKSCVGGNFINNILTT